MIMKREVIVLVLAVVYSIDLLHHLRYVGVFTSTILWLLLMRATRISFKWIDLVGEILILVSRILLLSSWSSSDFGSYISFSEPIRGCAQAEDELSRHQRSEVAQV